ncbi:MAG: hypothetical protein R3346_01505 [Candidatus Spechtbacterales bacterium]|nr:hypothetical protein [Candidatus Spechtbacterales bacterium]
MNWLLDPEDQLVYIIAFMAFVIALLFEMHIRAKNIRKENSEKPHSKRIDQGLAMIRDEDIEKLTNDKWQELTGASHATATRDLNHLVDMGLLKKKGRGRGVYYVFEKSTQN